MSRAPEEIESLSLLGQAGVSYPTDYNPGVLETFDNKHPEDDYIVTFVCPEFTSLCPKTGQPDFGRIIINDLAQLMEPRYIEVRGEFMPRGGISIIPFANSGDSDHQNLVEARRLAAFPLTV